MTIEERAEELMYGFHCEWFDPSDRAEAVAAAIAALRAVRAEAVEEAAKVAEYKTEDYWADVFWNNRAVEGALEAQRRIAAAIRAIATTGKETK